MLTQRKHQLLKKISSVALASTVAASAAAPSIALAEYKASDQYVYTGLELGRSEPVWKNFDYKDLNNRKTKIGIKNSRMVGGRVGWSFYPNMALELSGTHQPKHSITYVLPKIEGAFPFTIPETAGRTKVTANVYTLNLLYRLPSLQFATITPYVIGGAGISQINIASTSSSVSIPAPYNMMLGNSFEYFRVKKTKTNAPTYQAGIGFVKEFGDYFEIDISSKFQIIQNVKINYEQYSKDTGKFEKKKPIKKTIAMSEFALGILFKLPI